MKLHTKLAIVLGLAVASGAATAGPILIVNGQTGTSEPGTTSAITANLADLHTDVGNVVTIANDIPTDLSPYTQVWDIRFSNVFALTPAQRAQYIAFLADGGGMFVMGENDGFTLRNDSVLALISEAGGGNLAFTLLSSLQTVEAPFDGPNPIGGGNVNYAAPGGVTSPGTGQYITHDGAGNGTGVAWGVGSLANALPGALTVIFDVNFMQNFFDLPDSQNLTKNLIGFVGDQVEPPVQVPEPTSLALTALGLLSVAGWARRRRNQSNR